MIKAKTWILFMVPILVLFVASSAVLSKNEKGPRTLRKTMSTESKLIDVNQIAAWMSNDGILCSDPITGQSGLFYPKGAASNYTVIYTAGLWVVGKIAGDIRSAAADYATEFQPGAILGIGGPPDNAADPKYKIFKFKTEDWDSPEMAADKEEAFAQGLTQELSYTVDPATGDTTYLMYGDQMLYCVYNDYKDHSGVWCKVPIGLEVQMLAFGFNRMGALGSTIFLKYTFINKGTSVLTDAYVAQFFDPDNGGSSDDAVGCDTTLGIGYVYNIDSQDEIYGESVPSFGCDFLQGPVVPSVGDTAYLPGQPPLPDHKVLPMTSFGPYINGGPTGMGDPRLQTTQGAQMAYWFCSGLKGDGSPWMDPTEGDAVTRWPFYGDPITRTGWYQEITWHGDDMRMSLASGPFTLEIGVPYTVVVGYVVGKDATNLKSIALMKSYDRSAQIAYDLNFNISKPAPYPTVEVIEADRKVTLRWDTTMTDYKGINEVDRDSLGNPSYYNFEGFKLYQGQSAGGPWTLLQQWDLVNGITKIWDYVYDPLSGENVYQPVQLGSDRGIVNYFVIDRDYIRNTPLVNGRAYYFSLVTYSYDEWGNPRVLENTPKTITVIPQHPVLTTEMNSSPGQVIPVTHTAGVGQGVINATVVDPNHVTGDDYEIGFAVDSQGRTVWILTDKTTGTVVVDSNAQLVTALELDNAMLWPIVDGLEIKVAGPAPGITDVKDKFAGAQKLTYKGSDGWWDYYEYSIGCYGPAAFWGDGSVFDETQLKYVLLKLAKVDKDGVFDPNDENVSYGYRYLRAASAAPAQPEFAPFIVNPGPGYAYQDYNKGIPLSAWDVTPGRTAPRRLMVGHFENNVLGGLVDGKYWPPYYKKGNTAPREWLFIYDADYSETPNPDYMIAAASLPGTAIMYWLSGCRYDTLGWSLGVTGEDQFKILCALPNTPADKFNFTTKNLENKTGVGVAKNRLDEIQVFPNPYFASNKAETDFFSQFVTFSNLPEKCTIRIFSLSGQMMRTIEHTNGTPFERWDLNNEDGRPAASGIYIGLIQIPDVGEKILKIAIVNREARYRHF